MDSKIKTYSGSTKSKVVNMHKGKTEELKQINNLLSEKIILLADVMNSLIKIPLPFGESKIYLQ